MLVRAIKKDDRGFSEWQFGHGYTDYIGDQQQINQDIYTALYEFKYDAFWALQNGIDWRTRLGYHNQKDLLDADVQNLILNRQGVLSIENFESFTEGRHYNCICKIYTIYTGNEFIKFEFNI